MKTYTTTQVNKEFKIKVFGLYNGKKINTLVGVSGLRNILGSEEKMQKMFDRAFNCLNDVCHCKVYGGVKVSFYHF